MVALKVKEVDLGEFGVVEFREPLFKDIVPHIGKDDVGLRILELSAYQDDKRIFDAEVGVAFGMALLKHVGAAMEVCGMAAEKKELPAESD